MCYSEESMEFLEIWYVTECALEALEEEIAEAVQEAA